MNIVVTPGFMLDADLWTDTHVALEEIGPVLCADFSEGTSIEAFADKLLEDALPGPFLLIGFSMGGYVARQALRRAPDRVAALVMCGTSARGDGALQARRQASAGAKSAKAFTGLSRNAILRAFANDEADPALVERVRQMGDELGGEVFMRQSNLHRAGDLELLGQIRCPTLVIAGENDRLRSIAESEELRDGIPGATMTVMPAVGHMMPMEAPDALSRIIIDWWKSLGIKG
jgi:pimeloyl-ACP methyl ester carboxylesterase